MIGSAIGARLARAQAIQGSGGVDAALATGALVRKLDVTPSEALVIGLLRQGVRKYIGVFGRYEPNSASPCAPTRRRARWRVSTCGARSRPRTPRLP